MQNFLKMDHISLILENTNTRGALYLGNIFAAYSQETI